MKAAVRIAAFALLLTAPLIAAVIDVTSAPAAYVHPGAAVAVQINLTGYAAAAYGGPAYPSEIRFSILGPKIPLSASIDGSSAQYEPGLLFQGWLESLDGSYSLPLVDAGALRMGLPEGMLLAGPGTATVGGTPMSVSVIDGFVFLEPGFAEALGGTARIRLVNRGEGFTIGLGDLLPVRNSVWTTGLSADGSFAVGGVTGRVEIMNPEPSGWLLMASGVIFLVTSLLKRKVNES
jgi:hypothetical protein